MRESGCERERTVREESLGKEITEERVGFIM